MDITFYTFYRKYTNHSHLHVLILDTTLKKPMMIQFTKSLVVLTVIIVCVSAWSGNVCSRLKCISKWKKICSYRSWLGCCAYRYTWVTQYTRERFCCKGWTDRNRNQNCNIPKCRPRCKNGGTCTAPNQCQCKPGYKGPTCTGVTCSHLKPCYPGMCTGRDQCQCDSGFTGNTCLVRRNFPEQRTQIWLFRSTLKSVQRTTMMMNYEFVLESSNPNEGADESIWSNHLDLNYFIVESLGQFEPNIDSQRPSYVRSADFGVVESTLTLTHTKIPRPGETVKPDVKTYPCSSRTNDNIPGIWNCTVMEKNFKMKIESGDELRMTMLFKSGGTRELVILGGNKFYRSETFNNLTSSKSIVFKFDKDAPTHCQSDGSCNDNDAPLEVNDLTKTGAEIRWGGWRDEQLSGMFRYAVEIFKLEVVDSEGRLGEKKPLNPLQISEYMHANFSSVLPIRYTPSEPGMYSVILEASDRANNSRWARRLFLYDDRSEIELKSNITVPFAVQPDSNSVWLSTLDSDLEIVWSGHFVNPLHVENNLLNEVKDYPNQFSDIDPKMGDFKIKRVTFDADSGTRSKSAVRNIGGIVNFDFVLETDDITIRKSFLQEKHTIRNSELPDRSDGSSFKLFITAKDILSNSKTDNKTIRFDSSPPVMSDLIWEDNLPVPTVPIRRPKRQTGDSFASRILVEASDKNSGIHEIRWHISRRNTSVAIWEDVRNGSVAGIRLQSCEQKTSCYCISGVGCFDTEHVVNLNMCWFSVARAHINTASAKVTIDAVNPAGLSTSKDIQVMKLESLLKKSYFAPVDNIAVQNVGSNFVTIEWNSTKSCLPVSEFWLLRSDRREKEKVHRLRHDYEIAPLDPDSNYTIQFISGYDGEMSDPVYITFRTGHAPSVLSSGGAEGLSAGLIALILLVLAVVGALYMKGFIGNRRNNKKRLHEYESPKRTRFDGNEDIYVYGFAGGNLNLPTGHVIGGSNLILQELIEQGKFAKIYKATVLGNDGDKSEVAAKMLLDNFSDDERHLMGGKITFMSDVITGHDNVLKFIGAVTDNKIWGPTMVIEYCENGTLISWLHKNKNNVNDDVIERLYQISFGVVKGMTYLASLNVVHRRLAARNILLTFILEPKITGFGPSVIDSENGEKERVAIRWASPECFSNTKNATEKSDVWSFGIVLYEIFSLGDKPYPTLTNNEVIPKVRSGFQMNRPEFSDQFNYDLMLKCWQLDQIQRLSFEQLRDQYHVFMNGEEQTEGYSNYKY
ncbi:hypothetical protein LOTGIDRAFT_238308 [Lottia gigantea]|uniref:Receptor protein-tyrosine kinase n=1 Tax=Lottia gigantea TaxID=225164 RepID=V4AV45_LOTGI|nr:hypothetical protein LOTGIDRAFT_238308 [Lottia gigantea]ESP01183.1 hypothetical protein LOTGIDRAFT_238308 [Lottia gigantea]